MVESGKVLSRVSHRSLKQNCLDKLATAAEGPLNTSLNFVEVIPSPPTSRSKEVVTLHAITRAQAKNRIQEEPMKKSSKKRRRK